MSNSEYLTFFIAGDEYAISILQVTEILECSALTRIPGTPQWIRGVLNLRGAVVPVIDLAIKFGLPQTDIARQTCVVIVELEVEGTRVVMGVMADQVHEVVDLAADQIQPPPAFGPKVRVDCILGMGLRNGAFIVLLDIDRILSTVEIQAASAASSDSVAVVAVDVTGGGERPAAAEI